MALVFTLIVGLVVAAILTYAGSSVTLTDHTRHQRKLNTQADGAMDAAINWVRQHPGSAYSTYNPNECGGSVPAAGEDYPDPVYPASRWCTTAADRAAGASRWGLGRDNSAGAFDAASGYNDPPCYLPTPDLADRDGGNRPITVSCTGQPGSGLPATPGDVPKNAIQSLGSRQNEPGPRNDSIALDNFIPSTGLLRAALDGLGICNGETNQDWREAGIRFQTISEFCGNYQLGAKGTLNVTGNITSASDINIENGASIVSSKNVVARGNCYGSVNASTSRTCANYGIAQQDPRLQDPADATGPGVITGSWDHRPLPPNNGNVPSTALCNNQQVIKFSPGTFTSAQALNNFFASTACKNKTIWFQPGVYYFNFKDAHGTYSPACGHPLLQGVDFAALGNNFSGLLKIIVTWLGQQINGLLNGVRHWTGPDQQRHQWCVGHFQDSNQIVVGGAPNAVNWPNTNVAPATDPNNVFRVPTSDDPYGGLCDPSQEGVQFVFGGDSRLYVADGSMELCAGPRPDKKLGQQIAIYDIPEVYPTKPKSPYVSAATSNATVSGAGNAAVIAEPSVNPWTNNQGTATLNNKATCSSLTWGCFVNLNFNILGFNNVFQFGLGYHDASFEIPLNDPTRPDGSPIPNTTIDQIRMRLSYLNSSWQDSTVYRSIIGFIQFLYDFGIDIWIIHVHPFRPLVDLAIAIYNAITGSNITADSLFKGLFYPKDPRVRIGNCRIVIPRNYSSVGSDGKPKVYGPGWHNIDSSAWDDYQSYWTSGTDPSRFEPINPDTELILYDSSRPASQNCIDPNNATQMANLKAYYDTEAFGAVLYGSFGFNIDIGFLGIHWHPRWGFDASSSSPDYLDGTELTVLRKSTNGHDNAEVPAGGCITASPNYWEGLGNPDCAVLKADQINSVSSVGSIANWFGNYKFEGHVSVKGTVYAPSAAVDLADDNVKASWFTRGMVVRTLRVKSYKCATGYTAVCAGTIQVPNSPDPAGDRVVDFKACIDRDGNPIPRDNHGPDGKCTTNGQNSDDGLPSNDLMLLKASVRFQPMWTDDGGATTYCGTRHVGDGSDPNVGQPVLNNSCVTVNSWEPQNVPKP